MDLLQTMILLIDDDKSSLKVMEIALQSISNSVHSTTNGFQGVELAQTLQFPVIIVDILLPRPGHNGIEIIDILKSEQATADLVIIAITAGDRDLLRQASEAGADFILAKPLNIIELRELVADILSSPA